MCRNVPKELQCEVFRLPTACHQRGNPDTHQIVAAYVPYRRRGQPVRPTLLFSHGNAVDLGQMMPFDKCAGLLGTCMRCHWTPLLHSLCLAMATCHFTMR